MQNQMEQKTENDMQTVVICSFPKYETPILTLKYYNPTERDP